MFFIIEQAKQTLLDFPQGTANILQMCYRMQFQWII